MNSPAKFLQLAYQTPSLSYPVDLNLIHQVKVVFSTAIQLVYNRSPKYRRPYHICVHQTIVRVLGTNELRPDAYKCELVNRTVSLDLSLTKQQQN